MDDTDRPVIFSEWNGTMVMLTYNEAEDASKVWTIPFNNMAFKTQLSTEYFYESDVPYNYDDKYRINALAVYKDRLYAGCDKGLVIVFTDCVKCYKLKKVADVDIKTMAIEDGVMYISDGETDLEVKMSAIGGDSIEPDEARLLISKGALLVDVRDKEDYDADSIEGSINIPFDQIDTLDGMYDTNTEIIFVCYSGNRAARAVEKAAEMGYTNTYNGGGYERLK